MCTFTIIICFLTETSKLLFILKRSLIKIENIKKRFLSSFKGVLKICKLLPISEKKTRIPIISQSDIISFERVLRKQRLLGPYRNICTHQVYHRK